VFGFLFFLKQWAVSHNMVYLATLEASRELFQRGVPGLAEVLPFAVFFNFLEELLKFLSYDGNLLLIRIRIIL